MIAYPKNWQEMGQPINYLKIQDTLCLVLSEIGCRNLSLSGGLDSSYMLYCMVQVFGPNNIHTYTVVGEIEHPDYIYSRMIAGYFDVEWHPWILPPDANFTGDQAICEFYEHLTDLGVQQIIACDGIDEFMCGYYAHQQTPTEDHYYRCLRAILEGHLKPLDKVSLDVKVHLPYLDERLIALYSQIPINEKVDFRSRKKVMMSLALGNIPDEILSRRKYGFCDAGLSRKKMSDAEIAAQRLEEIKSDPSVLVSGKELSTTLDNLTKQ